MFAPLVAARLTPFFFPFTEFPQLPFEASEPLDVPDVEEETEVTLDERWLLKMRATSSWVIELRLLCPLPFHDLGTE